MGKAKHFATLAFTLLLLQLDSDAVLAAASGHGFKGVGFFRPLIKMLQGPLENTLLAISAGAVFIGANTYIENAPNFMVKSIAERNGAPMPGFFGYMGWSVLFLIPIFALVTLVFFM